MLTEQRGAVLVAATMAMGLTAGVFGMYAHTLMRGLGRTDDRTFVAAFQAIDRAIINPVFVSAFLGSLVLTGLAALAYRHDGGPVFRWVVAALVLFFVAFLITVTVHVPRNDAIKAAGDPDRITDLAAVRAAFDEGRWAAWNVLRAIVTTVAFGCLAWALVLQGRADGRAEAPPTGGTGEAAQAGSTAVVAERLRAGAHGRVDRAREVDEWATSSPTRPSQSWTSSACCPPSPSPSPSS